jgi:hypothetical protein
MEALEKKDIETFSELMFCRDTIILPLISKAYEWMIQPIQIGHIAMHETLKAMRD